MLADGGSKVMPDLLATALMKDSAWYPTEHKILLRANMDGADTVDRMRSAAQTHDLDNTTPERDGWETWFGVGAGQVWSRYWDRVYDWYTSSCTEVKPVAGGCGGNCPFCTETVYEEEADRTPFSFWFSK